VSKVRSAIQRIDMPAVFRMGGALVPEPSRRIACSGKYWVNRFTMAASEVCLLESRGQHRLVRDLNGRSTPRIRCSRPHALSPQRFRLSSSSKFRHPCRELTLHLPSHRSQFAGHLFLVLKRPTGITDNYIELQRSQDSEPLLTRLDKLAIKPKSLST